MRASENIIVNMMTSKEIRQTFLEFFRLKQHTIVPSAPLVIKDDPTLMFTNAGMNQFKDIFLGNKIQFSSRVADTQKCLRVSGKHNDLEEVGIDTYHHTMFEMLGNWSFGDPSSSDGIGNGYFKKEAIAWSWELLTEVFMIPVERLYVTVFEGDEKENLPRDEEAFSSWKKLVSVDRIIFSNKKDNFWEMGETGPCGPCSEIHVDARDDDARKDINGRDLVNKGDPEVIEIWNLVFMQFNRLVNGSLQQLPARHVDTGMGFERLTRVMQQKRSNYETDIFHPLIEFIEQKSGINYGADEKTDIAMRVMSDHIRAIAFAIADGQIPSNTGAGYVIRRILRRAVRYYYSFLNIHSPVLHDMVAILSDQFENVFPEIKSQQVYVARVIEEEENSFLKTLESGLKRIALLEKDLIHNDILKGKTAFELYDTFGFPIDLTRLIAQEKNWTIDEIGFYEELEKQKSRSRRAAEVVSSDWTELKKVDKIEFAGYDLLETKSSVVKYRRQNAKDREIFQLVLDRTPFYPESGGQVGDKGKIIFGKEEVEVLDTKKENDLIIHFLNKFPELLSTADLRESSEVIATINRSYRFNTMANHTATHLLHAALRNVLGDHVQQKGSLVAPDHLRFDFSHFSKIAAHELESIEMLVNEKIRQNILREVQIMPVGEAVKSGARALFGEKYGEQVRVVTFDKNFSRELCGGTHVPATGMIGYFKIVSESAVAAGIRRIEAITGITSETLIRQNFDSIENLKREFGNDPEKGIAQLKDENTRLKKQVEEFSSVQLNQLKKELKSRIENIHGVNFIAAEVSVSSPDALKKLAYDLRNETDNLFFAAGAAIDNRAHLCIIISDQLVKEKTLDAAQIIRDISREINGGGGGQKFFATAGGTNVKGIQTALKQAKLKLSK
ncbi:MAG: alanine--tRNA ligase [Chitinophagales bacterium]